MIAIRNLKTSLTQGIPWGDISPSSPPPTTTGPAKWTPLDDVNLLPIGPLGLSPLGGLLYERKEKKKIYIQTPLIPLLC